MNLVADEPQVVEVDFNGHTEESAHCISCHIKAAIEAIGGKMRLKYNNPEAALRNISIRIGHLDKPRLKLRLKPFDFKGVKIIYK